MQKQRSHGTFGWFTFLNPSFVSMIRIHALETGPVATFGYLVLNTEAASATVIDTPHGCVDTFVTLAADHGCAITDILLTHSHWDHTADCEPLRRVTNARVHCHPADAYRLTDPMAHTIWQLPFAIEAVHNWIPLELNEAGIGRIVTPAIMCTILHTPGHTEGSVVFHHEESSVAFVGDTLFAESVGRTDLPGGDFTMLTASIMRQIWPLPDATVCLPGHGPQTTVGHEREHNPFVGRPSNLST